MRAALLWVFLAAVPAFASGTSVCLEWEVVDAGAPDSGADTPDASVAKQGGEDAGSASIYGAPARRCLRYGYQYAPSGGCSAVPGPLLALLGLLVARWRR